MTQKKKRPCRALAVVVPPCRRLEAMHWVHSLPCPVLLVRLRLILWTSSIWLTYILLLFLPSGSVQRVSIAKYDVLVADSCWLWYRTNVFKTFSTLVTVDGSVTRSVSSVEMFVSLLTRLDIYGFVPGIFYRSYPNRHRCCCTVVQSTYETFYLAQCNTNRAPAYHCRTNHLFFFVLMMR